MRAEYIWEIKVKNTPTLKRKCNHCGCNRFYCSDKFRMNSQKRNIDVWLIYRCTECDSTYNLTILSRSKPERIKKEMFRKFSENNEATAWRYAFSPETARKNSVELDYSSVEYEILHDIILINDILNADSKVISFRIQIPFEFGMKLWSVIRFCLSLSVNQLTQMIEIGAIFISEGHLQKNRKVKNGDIVLVIQEKLRGLYSNKIVP